MERKSGSLAGGSRIERALNAGITRLVDILVSLAGGCELVSWGGQAGDGVVYATREKAEAGFAPSC